MAQIKQIKLPNNVTYDIYDAAAIHSLEDIQGLGLEGAFVFKGVVAKVSNLPTSGNTVGWVYHVTEDGSEYVWTTENKWEEFGKHILIDHTHDFSGSASLNGSASVTGTNADSAVTVTGTNAQSAVSGSGTISVPKVTKAANYIKVNSSIGNVAVAGDGTATPITGFGEHTTKAAITELNTTSVNSASETPVTASKVTATAGSAAVWTGEVVDDGVLTISWTANVPTVVSAEDVSASKVTTSEVTVATGAKSTADAITALGTPTTATVLTGVKVSTQPTLSVSLAEGTSADTLVGDTVAISSEDKTVSITGTAAGQVWSQATGTAAGQVWTQATGTATVSGSISGTTGKPKEA